VHGPLSESGLLFGSRDECWLGPGFAVVQGTREDDRVLSEAAVAFQASSGEGEAVQRR
jgi:hypothetical protein